MFGVESPQELLIQRKKWYVWHDLVLCCHRGVELCDSQQVSWCPLLPAWPGSGRRGSSCTRKWDPFILKCPTGDAVLHLGACV